jgi:hypothetical protein
MAEAPKRDSLEADLVETLNGGMSAGKAAVAASGARCCVPNR